jgi:3-methyladenine DNA glycosylase Mpg
VSLLVVPRRQEEGVLVLIRRKATRVQQLQHHVLGGVGSQSGDTHSAEALGVVVAGEEARRAEAGRIKTTELMFSKAIYIYIYIYILHMVQMIDQNQNNSVLSVVADEHTRQELARRPRPVAAGPGRTTLVRPWIGWMEITSSQQAERRSRGKQLEHPAAARESELATSEAAALYISTTLLMEVVKRRRVVCGFLLIYQL